ncbi:hypothetical protein Tco_0729290 [Tanacetum coccineum]|uniref:Uncharacterized protein n=1 Tax=Tanacetum coccineum TaxID=301880 RepID=A0ABQ4YNG8_9ASTR
MKMSMIALKVVSPDFKSEEKLLILGHGFTINLNPPETEMGKMLKDSLSWVQGPCREKPIYKSADNSLRNPSKNPEFLFHGSRSWHLWIASTFAGIHGNPSDVKICDTRKSHFSQPKFALGKLALVSSMSRRSVKQCEDGIHVPL